MAENVIVRECPAGVSEDVAAYWEQKLPQIESSLKKIPASRRSLRLNFRCDEIGYTARVVLTLPTGTLVTRTDQYPLADHRTAIDQVVEKLMEEIRRHREQLRDDSLQGRKRRREGDFLAAEPHLRALHGEQDREGFFDVLRPLLRHLGGHARRELTIGNIEGSIPPGQLTVDDLLDEVLVRAWDHWDERPRDQALDRWLVGLLHEVLDERGFKPPDERREAQSQRRASEKASASIYDRTREDYPGDEAQMERPTEKNPNWPYEPENEWAIENNPFWPFADGLFTLDDVLPAKESSDPAEQVAAEEERRLIMDQLRQFSPDQRRAFMLFALEGWTIDEIAQAQNRPRDQVRADIEAMRHALRQRLEQVVTA